MHWHDHASMGTGILNPRARFRWIGEACRDNAILAWGPRDRNRAFHNCKVNLVEEQGGMSGDLYILPSIMVSFFSKRVAFAGLFIRSVEKGEDVKFEHHVPDLMKKRLPSL